MKLFVLVVSGCWAEGFDIIGIYEDKPLATHAMNKIIDDENSIYTKDMFRIYDEVLQTW